MTRKNQEKFANTGRQAVVLKVNAVSLLMQVTEISKIQTAQEEKARRLAGMEADVLGSREEGASLDTTDKAAKEEDNTKPAKVETK